MLQQKTTEHHRVNDPGYNSESIKTSQTVTGFTERVAALTASAVILMACWGFMSKPPAAPVCPTAAPGYSQGARP